MSQRTQDVVQKEFETTLKALSYSKDRGTVFSDWLEMAAISLRQLPFNAGQLPKDDTYQEYETQYLDLAGRYSREELNGFAKLTALTVEGIQTHPCDFLGEVCSSLELTNEDAGQFFTPFTISTAVAKMTTGDVKKQVEDKGIITISDPASGAGGMLMAAAYEIANQNIDPRNHVQFHATDISRNCFNMTYLQLSLMDLQAVVQHGNTLSMEMWETRKTPQMMLFEDWLEKARANDKTAQIVEKMREFLSQMEQPKEIVSESAVEEKQPQPIQADVVFKPEQLSLFDSNEYQQE